MFAITVQVLLDRVQFIVSRGTGLADAADGEEESYETINMNKDHRDLLMGPPHYKLTYP